MDTLEDEKDAEYGHAGPLPESVLHLGEPGRLHLPSLVLLGVDLVWKFAEGTGLRPHTFLLHLSAVAVETPMLAFLQVVRCCGVVVGFQRSATYGKRVLCSSSSLIDALPVVCDSTHVCVCTCSHA